MSQEVRDRKAGSQLVRGLRYGPLAPILGGCQNHGPFWVLSIIRH